MSIEHGKENKRKLSLKEVLWSIGCFIIAGLMNWILSLIV